MDRLLSLIENLALWLACAALLAMGAIVTGSALGRTMFNAPIPDDLLMVGLLMVCVIILPLAYVERGDGHIAVTVVTDRLPARVRHALSALGRCLFGAFIGTMGWMLALKVPKEMAGGLYYDGRLEIPTWPMKAIFAFGAAVFLIRLAVNVVRDLRVAAGHVPPPDAGGTAPH
ncbi:MAG: TRAP transporter small permease [Rhodobacteraceae bacterium]|nr:TRAP transporter small permease [Paracoccaceae bacterium]